MTRDEALISAALEMAARRINSDDMRWLSRCQVADAIRAIDVDEALAGLPTAPDAVARDAVLEEAAKALERFAENLDCGHPESRLCDCGPFVEQWGFAADEVRALKSSVQPEPILSPAATETVPVPVARLVEAAIAEYLLEPPFQTELERMGRKATARGMMVRLGIYEKFKEALAAMEKPQ